MALGALSAAQAAEGPGLRSARWVLHPRLELSGAYDSNFFRDAPDEAAAPVDPVWHLDVEASARVANRQPQRLGVKLELGAGWRELWPAYGERPRHTTRQLDARSGLDAARGALELAIMPRAPVTLGVEARARYSDEPVADRLFDEGFQRLDVEAGPDFRFRPGGAERGAVSMTLGYRFAMVRFLGLEPDLGTARGQKDTHKARLVTRWHFFPKTAALLDARVWVINYPEVSDAAQNASLPGPDKDLTPVRVEAGVEGLLTPRLSATVKGGWSHSFNASGESYQGLIGRLELDYRLEPRLALRVGYARELDDDAYANFYTLDRVFVAGTLALPARVQLSARLGYDYLDYSETAAPRYAVGDRVEPVLRAEVAARWAFAAPLSGVARWSMEDNRSDFAYDLRLRPDLDPALLDDQQLERTSYTRHVVSLGVELAY